jgi:prepilin-type processing-associated H-X9-DG protein
MKPFIHFERNYRTPAVPLPPAPGFTLTELLVVVGTLAVLALLLVPALAGTKTDVLRLQCQDNLKQLQVGMQLFTQDHNDMFPPSCYASSYLGIKTISWDSWIYSYISGGRSLTVNQGSSGHYAVNPTDAAILGTAVGLPVLACPIDAQLPKAKWMHVANDPSQPLYLAPRTYEMISAGSTWPVDIEVDPQSGKYPLPDLNQPGRHGVGICWSGNSTTVDWDAKGYKTSVVKDPAGTILLAEDASNWGNEGGQWPCCCVAPVCSPSFSAWSALFQIDPNAPTGTAILVSGDISYSEGSLLYPAQGNRFNYLFHDGHVAALKIEQTVGIGTTTSPKGMWTVAPGD